MKSIFASKTFWANILMAAATVTAQGSGFPIPPQYAIPISAVVNILLRFVTVEPVSVMGR